MSTYQSPDPSLLLSCLDPLSGHPHPSPLPFAAPWHYELHFPRDPRGPGVVRVALRAVLRVHGLGEFIDRAEVLTCELATNSVRHTEGPASVRMQWLHPVLRVSVYDTCPDLPLAPGTGPAATAPHAEAGRGLLILDALADRWGGCAIGPGPWGDEGGKSIWFELRLGEPEPTPSALAA